MAKPSLDPVDLQVMTGALRAACDEMGAVLIRSAHSPNITERHDCSTALFDAGGELVMQAEHIPVHLGSMPDAVAVIVDEEHRDGDLWILNDPYRGGTHLPDITLISPIFERGELLGFAASRAHHADIGGITPGSMPPFSTRIEEEGVQIDNFQLVDRGQLREQEMLELLRSGPHPSRNPEQNMGDLKAQIAANAKGVQELHRMVDQFGLDV